jgi:hypothetical protein
VPCRDLAGVPHDPRQPRILSRAIVDALARSATRSESSSPSRASDTAPQ